MQQCKFTFSDFLHGEANACSNFKSPRGVEQLHAAVLWALQTFARGEKVAASIICWHTGKFAEGKHLAWNLGEAFGREKQPARSPLFWARANFATQRKKISKKWQILELFFLLFHPPALSCPPDSHYELCARTCDQTCASLSAGSSCTSKCFEGCQCDEGFVFNGGECVPMESCGCMHRGRFFEVGAAGCSHG